LRHLQRATALIAGMVVVVACSGSDTEGPPGLQVVATTSVLGDVVANVVRGDAELVVLMPVGADPHDFAASSQQVAAIHEADLVVANGYGLEEGLTDVLESAGDDGVTILYAAESVTSILEGPEEDPHFWLDPLRMGEAVSEIGLALAAVDDTVDWATRTEAYQEELEGLHEEMVVTLETVPAKSRKLVTNHDSFAYFEDRFGFEVIGVVIPGGSTLGLPSSEDLVELVRVINAENVSAIFAETTHPSVLVAALAEEIETPVEVVDLYIGSLGEPASGADTYVGMLMTNAELIANALD